MTSPAPDLRVYRAPPRTRRILLAVWALCLLVPGLMVAAGLATGDQAGLVAGLAVAGLISAIMLPIFWLAAWRYPRLELGSEGLVLHQLGLRLETGWDNVSGLVTEGPLALVLAEPLAGSGADRQAAFGGTTLYGAPLYDEAARRLIAERRYLPLSVFAPWLTQGELAYDLARLAPQLIPDLKAIAERPARSGRRPFLADAAGRPLPRSSWVAIGSLVVLGLGLAFLLESGPAALASTLVRALEALTALALAVYGLANLVAAARCFGGRQWLPGLLWGALALLQGLIVLALVGSLMGGAG